MSDEKIKKIWKNLDECSIEIQCKMEWTSEPHTLFD